MGIVSLSRCLREINKEEEEEEEEEEVSFHSFIAHQQPF